MSDIYRPEDFKMGAIASDMDFDPEDYEVDGIPYVTVDSVSVGKEGYDLLREAGVDKLEQADYIEAVHYTASALQDSIEISGLVPKAVAQKGSGTWPPSKQDRIYFTGENVDNLTKSHFQNSWVSAPVRSWGGRPLKVKSMLDTECLMPDDGNGSTDEDVVSSLSGGAFAHIGPVTPEKEQGSNGSYIAEVERLDEPALPPLEKRWGGERYEYETSSGFWPSGWNEFTDEEQDELEEFNKALGEAWEADHQQVIGDLW